MIEYSFLYAIFNLFNLLPNIFNLEVLGSPSLTMAGRIPPEEASRSSQSFRGPFSEPRSQRRPPRQYPASLDTDLSLVTELRRSEEQAAGQRSLPNNLVTRVFSCVSYRHRKN